MCGIAGYFDGASGAPIERAAIVRMTDRIAHRGPDGEGVYTGDGVGLVNVTVTALMAVVVPVRVTRPLIE